MRQPTYKELSIANSASNLPTSFPRWCRAIFPWAGESKNDLGFIEGDFIECLNTGDGSWWVGRLHRDDRLMGFFPSNFVEVMNENFSPASQTPNPIPKTAAGSPPRKVLTDSQQQKEATLQKLLQSYEAPKLRKRSSQHDSPNDGTFSSSNPVTKPQASSGTPQQGEDDTRSLSPSRALFSPRFQGAQAQIASDISSSTDRANTKVLDQPVMESRRRSSDLKRNFKAASETTRISSNGQSITISATNSTNRARLNAISGDSARGLSATSAVTLVNRNSREKLPESADTLESLTPFEKKRTSFFKKLLDNGSVISKPGESRSYLTSTFSNVTKPSLSGSAATDTSSEGIKIANHLAQTRQDLQRSKSLSHSERKERVERCHLSGYPLVAPVNDLFAYTEGDEGVDGMPIKHPTDYMAATSKYRFLDQRTRDIDSFVPPEISAKRLALSYICLPYRSDPEKLRAIFIWVSETVIWEELREGPIDTRRVILQRRGCSKEIALIVSEMCSAVGLKSEVVRGYLKKPGDTTEYRNILNPNHWWNAVVCGGCWRIMDCSLASPTKPYRVDHSSSGPQADDRWFLARPTEICYTHIPSNPRQQHVCPPIASEILLALPYTYPPYFRLNLKMADFDTSLLRIENLELVHIQFAAPADVECVAEVEAHSVLYDSKALTQATSVNGQKLYTVKALLPNHTNRGILKVYAGKRGSMHSVKENPHPLAFALPILHTGNNAPYHFVRRYPTQYAVSNALYIVQPQCLSLSINQTYVFTIRQHRFSKGKVSPEEYSLPSYSFEQSAPAAGNRSRPALAKDEFLLAGSKSRREAEQEQPKPAKLAIQTPSGKMIRLSKKSKSMSSKPADGHLHETVIKISESGRWKGLVRVDGSGGWCVFAEWMCVSMPNYIGMEREEGMRVTNYGQHQMSIEVAIL